MLSQLSSLSPSQAGTLVSNPSITDGFGLSNFGVGVVSDDSRTGFSILEVCKGSDNGGLGVGFSVLTVGTLAFACKFPMSACRLMGRLQQLTFLVVRFLFFGGPFCVLDEGSS